jgi:hypothetical protein
MMMFDVLFCSFSYGALWCFKKVCVERERERNVSCAHNETGHARGPSGSTSRET